MFRHRPAGSGHLVDERRASCANGHLWKTEDHGERHNAAYIVDREGRQGDVPVFREERLRDGPSDRGVALGGWVFLILKLSSSPAEWCVDKAWKMAGEPPLAEPSHDINFFES